MLSSLQVRLARCSASNQLAMSCRMRRRRFCHKLQGCPHSDYQYIYSCCRFMAFLMRLRWWVSDPSSNFEASLRWRSHRALLLCVDPPAQL